MLLDDMNISRLMTHAQQVEGDKLREQAKDNKKARTGNYGYSQQKSGGGNRSFQQHHKGRASGSKSQGSVSGTRTYLTCPIVVRTIQASVLQGKKGVLDVHQQVARLSRVSHLAQVAVSARTGCMLFKLVRIRKILLMWSLVLSIQITHISVPDLQVSSITGVSSFFEDD
uniref:Gag-pol protein n=1 Tax=Solanum tuberosum TaxID=4113 RepID=M1DA07_SOLTU